MQWELTAAIARARRCCLGYQFPRGVEGVLGRAEVQRGLTGCVRHVDGSAFREEEVDRPVAVFHRACDHEWRPAEGVLRVYVEGRSVGEELYDWEVVVRECPVEWEAIIFVSSCGEFGICVKEGFYC